MGHVTTRRVSGWGRATTALSDVLVLPAAEVAAKIDDAGPRGVLGRGKGRSCGDTALNSGGRLIAVGGAITLDRESGTVTASAGTTFEQLLRACLPHG